MNQITIDIPAHLVKAIENSSNTARSTEINAACARAVINAVKARQVDQDQEDLFHDSMDTGLDKDMNVGLDVDDNHEERVQSVRRSRKRRRNRSRASPSASLSPIDRRTGRGPMTHRYGSGTRNPASHGRLTRGNIRSFQLFVKDLTGKTMTLQAHPTMTVVQLLEQVNWKLGTPLAMTHMLTFAGKQLEGHRELEQCEIGEDYMLHMTLRLRGS